jgi:hypothetical protein
VIVNMHGRTTIKILSLNLKKMKPITYNFRTKNSQQINVDISYDNKQITNISSPKFLAPIIDETL